MRPRLKINDNEYLFMDVHKYRMVDNNVIAVGRLRRYRFCYIDVELDDIKITNDVNIDEIKEFERKNGLIYVSLDDI